MKRVSSSSQLVEIGGAQQNSKKQLEEAAIKSLGREGVRFFARRKELRAMFLQLAAESNLYANDKAELRRLFAEFRAQRIPRGDVMAAVVKVTKLTDSVIRGDVDAVAILLTENADPSLFLARANSSEIGNELSDETQKFLMGHTDQTEFASFLGYFHFQIGGPFVGRNALTAAVAANKIQILTLLCKSAAETDLAILDECDGNGSTPLSLAVEDDLVDCCQTLLNAGANPNAPNARGQRPLEIAFAQNKTNSMDCLLKFGATIELDRLLPALTSSINSESPQCAAVISKSIRCELGVAQKENTAACKMVIAKINRIVARSWSLNAEKFVTTANEECDNAWRALISSAHTVDELTDLLNRHPGEHRLELLEQVREIVSSDVVRMERLDYYLLLHALESLKTTNLDNTPFAPSDRTDIGEKLEECIDACIDVGFIKLSHTDIADLINNDPTQLSLLMSWAARRLSKVMDRFLGDRERADLILSTYCRLRAATSQYPQDSVICVNARRVVADAYNSVSLGVKREVDNALPSDVDAIQFKAFINN